MALRTGVAIDLGTVNTLIWVAGRGLVAEEPSAVALNLLTGQVTAVGAAADVLAGKELRHVAVVHPLRDGVITDLDAAVAMLQGFLGLAGLRRSPLRSPALVCVPSGATGVERRSLAAAVEALRLNLAVALVDEPVAAAAGAGFDRADGAGGFIVDIGGGTTEIALLAGGHVVRIQSLRVAGNAMDEAVIAAVRAELGLLIGRNAARSLKMTVGLGGAGAGSAETVGIDTARCVPRAGQVPAQLVSRALDRPVATIISSVQEIISDVPPDLAEDVVRGKIRLAGGGALLPGLADRIETVTGMSVLVVDDPLRCVVRGAAELLSSGDWPRESRPA